MLPEPHNKPHVIATNVRPFDLGYASLYSRWVELYIYLVPVSIVASGLFVFIAFKAGASAKIVAAVVGLTLIVAKAAFHISYLVYPVYQSWKVTGARTTAHIFTAEGIELQSTNGPTLIAWKSLSRVVETKKGFLFYRGGNVVTFLPTRQLEGPVEADLIRKFIRKNVANATLLG